jgi:uncharacterized membrane protein (UPF0182 family)
VIDKPTERQSTTLVLGRERGGHQNYHVLHPSRRLKVTFPAAVAVIALLTIIPDWIQKGLWMRELGYLGIFWKLLSVRVELFSGAFVVTALYLWINLHLAVNNATSFRAAKLTKDATLETRAWTFLLQH